MHCRSSFAPMPALRRSLLIVATIAWLAASPSRTAAAAEDSASGAIQNTEILEAVKKLKADPDLATTRQVRTLRWVDDDEEEKRDRSNWFEWIGDLFGWIAEVSRVLVWAIIALLVALLALYLVRFANTFKGERRDANTAAPTHVRDLDIRPESLPDDIGAAAWTLWERGEHRNALSLLYRGLLSRLVHEHAVPIRDSTTEGDCLALAERHLPTDRHAYITRLIRTWQRAVYGGEDPQGPEMRALCDEFAAALRVSMPPQDVAA